LVTKLSDEAYLSDCKPWQRPGRGQNVGAWNGGERGIGIVLETRQRHVRVRWSGTYGTFWWREGECRVVSRG